MGGCLACFFCHINPGDVTWRSVKRGWFTAAGRLCGFVLCTAGARVLIWMHAKQATQPHSRSLQARLLCAVAYYLASGCARGFHMRAQGGNGPRSPALRAFLLLCARISTANLLRVSVRFCFPCARCHEPCATFYVFYGALFFFALRALLPNLRALWLGCALLPVPLFTGVACL